MLRIAAPALRKVTVCGALEVPRAWVGKIMLVADRLTIGAGGMPVPVSATVCGLDGLVELSVIFSVPVRVPVAVGEKVTFMVQLAPAATLPPQLSVSANSEAFVPVKATPDRVKAELPVLFKVMTWGGLVNPTI
jgi:hypothetical protein